MAKFMVGIPYTGWKYYEVEAEDVEDAKEKVFEQNDVSCAISLCWHCSESIDGDFELSEKDIYVEKN